MDSKGLDNLWFNSGNLKWKKLLFIVISIFPISFLMKFVSEWTHEFLGHCGIGFLVGGQPISYYVSWIWPLEFGYAFVSFPIGASNLSRAFMAGGGIIACLIAGISCQIAIYYVVRKRAIKSNIVLTILHILFWYGFWAFMNSTGYLLVGSFLNFGDIRLITIYTNISNWVFLIPGFLALLVFYYLISNNFNYLFKPFSSLKTKWKLFIFWLLLPVIFILVSLNSSITISLNLFFIVFPLMLVPSIISLLISNRAFSY